MRVHIFGVCRRWRRSAAGMTLLLLLGTRASGQASQPASPPMTDDPNRPEGIKQSPTRPNSWSDSQGRAYERSSVGTWTNYDESKAGSFTLPDPLVLKNGQPVNDAKTWWDQRRPEILNDFLPFAASRLPPRCLNQIELKDAARSGTVKVKDSFTPTGATS